MKYRIILIMLIVGPGSLCSVLRAGVNVSITTPTNPVVPQIGMQLIADATPTNSGDCVTFDWADPDGAWGHGTVTGMESKLMYYPEGDIYGTDDDVICSVTDTTDGTTDMDDVELYVPLAQTETESSSTLSDSRTTIGVGEDVDCTIIPTDTPGATGAIWENSGGGTFATNGGQSVTYTAYCQAGTDTLTPYLADGSTIPTVTFTVITPSVTNQPWWATDYNGNDYIGVDMWTYIYMGPDTVSFANCSWKEGYCPATTSGYWAYYSGLEHIPGGPISCIDNVVAGEGTKVGDSTIGDHVSLGTNGPTYRAGDFLWPIPHNYIANASGFYYLTQNHHAVLNVVSGEASETLTKAQATITSLQWP